MIKSVQPSVRAYLSEIGRRGGRRSRRVLQPQAAREMVKVREARRAFRRFHTQCFWFTSSNYRVTAADVPWVAEQLMRNGGREGWQVGARLCR
jgi:hypothetical protein